MACIVVHAFEVKGLAIGWHDTQVREWHAMGLPHDNVSVDSAIVAMHGRCWPLCIDPQARNE